MPFDICVRFSTSTSALWVVMSGLDHPDDLSDEDAPNSRLHARAPASRRSAADLVDSNSESDYNEVEQLKKVSTQSFRVSDANGT